MASLKLTACMAALLFLVGQCAAATLECEKYGDPKWTGPDTENDPAKCAANPERLRTQGWVLFVLLIPALCLFFTLFCFPAVWCCRKCGGCGSNKRRPGANCCCDGSAWDDVDDELKVQAYPKKYVNKIRTAAFAIFLFSIGVLIVGTVGGTRVEDGFHRFIDELLGIVDFLNSVLARVKFWATDEQGNFIPPLDAAAFERFENVTKDFSSSIEDIRSDYSGNVEVIHSVIVAIAAIPVIFLFFTFFFSAFDIRKCLPSGFTCLYFIWIIVYTILSILCFAFALILFHVCDEIDLQFERKPGLGQWYVVPTCEKNADFDSFKVDLVEAERENAVAACENFLAICDPSPDYKINKPQIVYQCNITDPATECTSLTLANKKVQEATFKLNTPVSDRCVVPNATGVGCSLQNCSNFCTNPTTKQVAQDTLNSLDLAQRFVNALNEILPLVECNLFVDRLLQPLRECHTFRDGFFLMGASTGVAYLLFMYAIVVLMIGQKVFAKRPKEKAQKELEEKAKAARRKRAAKRKEALEQETTTRRKSTMAGSQSEHADAAHRAAAAYAAKQRRNEPYAVDNQV